MTEFSALRQIPKGQDADVLIKSRTRLIASHAQRVFVLAAFAALCIFVIWARQTQLDVVTRGSGQVVPTLQNQFVQHLEGGIINEILVSEGQIVAAGDVLMRISDSFAEAEFERVNQQILTENAKLARLNAETEGVQNPEDINFPEAVRLINPEIVRDEMILFQKRRNNLDQRILILSDQLRHKELEKKEKQSRLQNTQLEFDLVNERVENLAALAQAGATSRNDFLRARFDLQQIRTRMSDLAFQIPQMDVEISELERRQNELRTSFIAEANEEKIEALNRIELLQTTLNAMQDRASRTDVRAPIDGKIHRLFQTTIGGVVKGGQHLAQLVPVDATVSVEIRLAPKDRGRVWVDLPAVVKLTAYDYSIYGSIHGRVTDISSDIIKDEEGHPYYRVVLDADTTSFGDNEIVAGMAAEVDIISGQRSISEYLLAPVLDIQEKALREY